MAQLTFQLKGAIGDKAKVDLRSFGRNVENHVAQHIEVEKNRAALTQAFEEAFMSPVERAKLSVRRRDNRNRNRVFVELVRRHGLGVPGKPIPVRENRGDKLTELLQTVDVSELDDALEDYTIRDIADRIDLAAMVKIVFPEPAREPMNISVNTYEVAKQLKIYLRQECFGHMDVYYKDEAKRVYVKSHTDITSRAIGQVNMRLPKSIALAIDEVEFCITDRYLGDKVLLHYLFVDIETSGGGPEACELLEFSAWSTIESKDGPRLDGCKRFHQILRMPERKPAQTMWPPHYGNGLAEECQASTLQPHELEVMFLRWLDNIEWERNSPVLVGCNLAVYDLKVLQRICPMIAARLKAMPIINVSEETSKLRTTKQIVLHPCKLHRSEFCNYATMQTFCSIHAMLK